jgi:hypothetical protein
MGVMLSLEEGRQDRGRRRRGQHSRTMEDQACLDALAAFLRSDATSAGRCLSRVSRISLASRLLPAVLALVHAADHLLSEQRPADLRVELDYALSPACLVGMCTGSSPGNPGTTAPCGSPTCQHSCHLP